MTHSPFQIQLPARPLHGRLGGPSDPYPFILPNPGGVDEVELLDELLGRRMPPLKQ